MSPAPPAPGEAPILAELEALGYETRSLADLRESGVRYRDAIPVLLRWLAEVKDRKLAEEIVRALSVPWAKPAATQPMVEAFRRMYSELDASDTGSLWAAGNALEVLMDDSVYDDLADLAQDHRYGTARQMVVLGLGKSKRPEAVHVLLSLMDDPEVNGHAVKALGRLRPPAARSALIAKLDDERTWVRNEARRALAKLPE